MGVLTQLVAWLNAGANALGEFFLAPVAVLPGWLSATLAAAATGVLLLVVFKYTSHQRAVKAVRDDLKAHLLSLKLFKDSAAVALRAQAGLLWGALRLVALSVVPILVMAVPVLLLLGQLALWYQVRPLHRGEEAVITLTLGGDPGTTFPDVRLEPTSALEVVVGPVRVFSKREVCWNVRAAEDGYHRLVFRVDGQAAEKELAVGGGFMRVSTQRPGWDWWDALLNPAEPPFGPDSPVRSITVTYPERSSWTSGTDTWVIYWFAVSMVAALCCRRLLNVHI
jgi:hypothetical protein